MPSQILTIARNTFLEAVRQPIFFIVIVLSGILTLFSVWGTGFSLGYTDTSEVSGDNKLLLDVGLANIFVCGVILAAFIATAVLSREIEWKTVLTVVSKPVPRPAVVIGKYLGVAGAMFIASTTMLFFLLIGIRHGVMSTAIDQVDQPVVVSILLALLISFGVGTWCNYFYGSSFTQVCTLLMWPLFGIAWVAVLVLSKKWEWQPLSKDFKDQIVLAGCAVVLSHLVMTAAAVAASARLGQVMTIAVCGGLFILGLLSNQFIGSRVFHNELIAKLGAASPSLSTMATMDQPGDTWEIELLNEAAKPFRPGESFYFGATPNGYPLSVHGFPPFEGDPTVSEQLLNPNAPPSLIVTSAAGRSLTVRRAGGDGDLVIRTPEPGDYVFKTPTTANFAALGLWGTIPNIQFFWLVDAVTQNQVVPLSHAGLICLYGLVQIGFFLSLAVILFQRREVG